VLVEKSEQLSLRVAGSLNQKLGYRAAPGAEDQAVAVAHEMRAKGL